MVEEFIGKYRVLHKLGAGGMASVFLAAHRDVPSLRVVLKEMCDPQMIERFRLEAEKLAVLDGTSGVCQIKDFFDANGRFYIAMEYIDGPTLDDLIRSDQPPDLDRSLALVQSVLTILDYAHRQGVIHRDIKPTNVMIARDGQVKIIDFGVAKGATDPELTQVGSSVGSPRYMAPEQFRTSETVDWVRCDIYAVGVMLYYMLAHRYPFEGADTYEIFEAKREGTFIPLATVNPAIPPDVEAAVSRAIARDPAQRFPSAAAMRDALGRAGAGTSTRPRQGVLNPEATLNPDAALDPGPAVLHPSPLPQATLPPTAPPPPPKAPTPPPPPTIPTPPADAAGGGRVRLRVGIAVVAVLAVAAVVAWRLLTPQKSPEPPEPRAVAPVVLAPRGEVIGDSLVSFRWTGSAAARGYRLVVADNADLVTPLFQAACPGTTHVLARPESAGTYYWRVGTEALSAGPLLWSTVDSFRVAAALPPPPPATARLAISLPPASPGRLTVDGRGIGTVRGDTTLTLGPGDRVVSVRYLGHPAATDTRNVTLVAGKLGRLTFDRPSQDRSEGDQGEDVSPVPVTVVALFGGQGIPGAHISIDGKAIGSLTPSRVQLRPGKHTFAVRADIDGEQWRGEIDVIVSKDMDSAVKVPLARK